MTRQQKDSAIAAAITMAVVLLLLLTLFFGRIGWSRELLASASVPEEPDEELFLEPELLPEPDTGEEESPLDEAPAAPVKGLPEPAPEEQPKMVEKQPEPTPAPPKEKVVTQKQPSPRQEPKPKGEEEKKKATSAVAGKFNNAPNGSVAGKFDSAGGTASSVGVEGKISGRGFLGCPKPDVTLANKTVVRVEVTVDADGKVTSASATGGASAAIRRACEAAARQARWTEKKGATSARGSITFTITPR